MANQHPLPSCLNILVLPQHKWLRQLKKSFRSSRMTIRVAINGYGRIGRMTLRAFYEQNKPHDIQIVAVNALGQDELARHVTQFDTVHGRFNASVSLTEDHHHVVVNGDHIRLLSERDPAKLPWDELDVDIVLECTGRFNSKESASAHLRAGAKKVLLSAPGGNR